LVPVIRALLAGMQTGVVLIEEGRNQYGMAKDDYEQFLEDEGYGGQAYTHGMPQNNYMARPWHLPEYCHPTYWTTKQMSRTIQRRDPTRPAFWYCSYISPHPPITPPKDYWDMYMNMEIDEPIMGDWSSDPTELPYKLTSILQNNSSPTNKHISEIARKAFYAQCTYIDHQIRLLIGTLREEGLIENTVIMFTCDHGDMLGNHGIWGKHVMYENSAKIPMILVPHADSKVKDYNVKDGRFAELRDVMPTLLDLCDIEIPETVEGHSLVSDYKRDYLYLELGERTNANRAVRDGDFKLIYYPVGNKLQLFNLKEDPLETNELSSDEKYKGILEHLKGHLVENLYGDDVEWVRNGELTGLLDTAFTQRPNRGLSSQRGWR